VCVCVCVCVRARCQCVRVCVCILRYPLIRAFSETRSNNECAPLQRQFARVHRETGRADQERMRTETKCVLVKHTHLPPSLNSCESSSSVSDSPSSHSYIFKALARLVETETAEAKSTSAVQQSFER
jgi:hypothetical protein